MNNFNSAVTYQHEPTQWFGFVQLSADTLYRVGTKSATLSNVLRILNQLLPDDYLNFMLEYYQTSIKHFGDDWGYMGILTALQAATKILNSIKSGWSNYNG